MVEIQIGETIRDYDKYDVKWIHQQIKRRRTEGINPCVKVKIQEGSLNLTLVSPNCPGTRAGSSSLDKQKKVLIDLWSKHIKNDEFTSGNLVAFLKQLPHYL